MSDILWLASYPKSGNTWLRLFLHNYLKDTTSPLPIDDMDLTERDTAAIWYRPHVEGEPAHMDFKATMRARPAAQAEIAAFRDGTIIVKTHVPLIEIDGRPLIVPELTKGAIYIVRNPLDVCLSLAHYWGCPVDEAIGEMGSTYLRSGPADTTRQVWDFYSSWSVHGRSWGTAELPAKLILKYEDLAADPNAGFAQLALFLEGRPADPERVERAVRHSDFKLVQRQEREHGFREQVRAGRAFFRRGRAGAWRQDLSRGQINRVIADHGEVMEMFGYDTSGR